MTGNALPTEREAHMRPEPAETTKTVYDLDMPVDATPEERFHRAQVARAKIMQLVNVTGEELGQGPALKAWMKTYYTPHSDAITRAKSEAVTANRQRLFKMAPNDAELATVDLDQDFTARPAELVE
jgi:hypothetical protein